MVQGKLAASEELDRPLTMPEWEVWAKDYLDTDLSWCRISYRWDGEIFWITLFRNHPNNPPEPTLDQEVMRAEINGGTQ